MKKNKPPMMAEGMIIFTDFDKKRNTIKPHYQTKSVKQARNKTKKKP
jgi:hypothetical protein